MSEPVTCEPLINTPGGTLSSLPIKGGTSLSLYYYYYYYYSTQFHWFTNTTQSIPYAALSGRLPIFRDSAYIMGNTNEPARGPRSMELTEMQWHDHASFVRRHLDHRCHPAEAPHRIGYNVGGHSIERVAVLRGE